MQTNSENIGVKKNGIHSDNVVASVQNGQEPTDETSLENKTDSQNEEDRYLNCQQGRRPTIFRPKGEQTDPATKTEVERLERELQDTRSPGEITVTTRR